MDKRTVAFYDKNAAKSNRFELLKMSGLQKFLCRHLPPGGCVLDVGCGSGRDAAYLVSRGFDVIASDASSAMLREAGNLHPELRGRLVKAAFPLGKGHSLFNKRFDAIIAIGVVMHLDDDALCHFAEHCRRLLVPEGVLAICTFCERVNVRNNRDRQGRLFFERPAGIITRLFKDRGFICMARTRTGDGCNSARPWGTFVFEHERMKAKSQPFP